jgi:hypothetical protein
MIPLEDEDERWARVRQGVSWATKAIVAVGLLAGLAQYVSRTTLDRAGLKALTTRGLDPRTTGSIARPKPARGASRVEMDQAGLTSLAAQASRKTAPGAWTR